MRKLHILLILLLSVTILVTFGCKKTKKQQSEISASESWDGTNYIPEEGAELTLWFDNEDMNIAILEEWEKRYPNIPLTYEVVGATDTAKKLTLDGPAGIGADVFVQQHDWISTAAQDGVMLPMANYTDRIKNEFNKQAVDVGIVDGQLFAIPWSIENIALFWNKDLYPGDPPKTWDEIIDFAKKYNDPAKNKWAIRWEVNNAYMDYFFLTAYGFRLFGPRSMDADNPGWESPEVIEGLKYFQSLRSIFDVAPEDATGEYTVAEFTKGTVPLTITGPWSIQAYKEAGLNFGVTKLPMLPGNKQPYTFSGTQVISVSSYTKYPNAARRLAIFLTEDEVLSRLYQITSKLPARKDLSGIGDVENDPYLKGILEQSEYSYPMPTIPEMNFAWEPQRYLFYYTWNGEMTPEEVVKKATEEYEAQRNSASDN